MVLTTRFKVLCAVAAAVGIYIVTSSPDPTTATSGAAAAVTRGDAAERPDRLAAAGVRPAAHDTGNLLTRLAHRVTESSAVAALFHTQSWYVPPPPPPPAPVVAVVPPSPTAPPLPFSVMGSYARPGDSAVFFLTRGDRVFDVHVGDTIDDTYSVDSYANGQLTLTYKPLKIQQTLAVGGSQ